MSEYKFLGNVKDSRGWRMLQSVIGVENPHNIKEDGMLKAKNPEKCSSDKHFTDNTNCDDVTEDELQTQLATFERNVEHEHTIAKHEMNILSVNETNNDFDALLGEVVIENELYDLPLTLEECEPYVSSGITDDLKTSEERYDLQNFVVQVNEHDSSDSSYAPSSHIFTSDDDEVENEDSMIPPDQAEETIEPSRKRAKKNKAYPCNWVQRKNQLKREKGLPYYSAVKTPNSSGDLKWKFVARKPERKLNPRCNCRLSQKNSKIKCGDFSSQERESIFKTFWDLSWAEKRITVQVLTQVAIAKDTKNRKNAISRRKNTILFYLKKPVGGQAIRVCKTMFLNTLGINEWSAINWAKKNVKQADENECMPKNRKPAITRKQEKQIAARTAVKDFLNILPKVESHYCRQSTSKLYLESLWISKSNVFREYQRYTADNNIAQVKFKVFDDVMNEMNIALFKPKKDQCDLCIAHRENNVSDEDYARHQEMKEAARREKENDKLNAKHVYTMDLQAVLLSPCLKASAIYYKTKLAVHNFTIYDLKTKKGFCYLWDESQGGLTANEFSSIICNFIIKEVPFQENDEIIFFSDGCGYQNRNATLSNALLNLAVTCRITITQKFLEKGHTQMECDSMHSKIEKQLRNQDIFLPSSYINPCKHARKVPEPYAVQLLDYSFFLNYTAACTFYKSIRPGLKTGDPQVADLRALQYRLSGDIVYKLHHQEQWKDLPQRRNRNFKGISGATIPKLYKEKLKIKKEKWNHLQQLKSVLHKDYHTFYDELPFIK